MTGRKFALLVIATLVVAVAWPADAEAARRRRRASYGQGAFAKDIGIGVILGAPTGLSGEIRMSPRTSIDLAVGVDAFNDRDLYVHADFLVYLADLAPGGTVGIPIYLGIGGFIWDHGSADHIHIGPRVPLGLAIAWRTIPIQMFFELALRFVLLDDDSGDLDLSGGIGFRIYF
jgi:hypothetical protein